MSDSEEMRAINDRLMAAFRERRDATLNVQKCSDDLRRAQEIEHALDDTVAQIKKEADFQRAKEALATAQWVIAFLIIMPAEGWIFCRACFDQVPGYLVKDVNPIIDIGNYVDRDDGCLGCGKIPAQSPEGGNDHG